MKLPIHHIALLVNDENNFKQLFKLMGWWVQKERFDESYGVQTVFLHNGSDVLLEFIIPRKNENLKRLLRKSGNHIHHIAFEVDSIDLVKSKFVEMGYRFLERGLEYGFENRKIVFMEPLSTKGILIEFMEKN